MELLKFKVTSENFNFKIENILIYVFLLTYVFGDIFTTLLNFGKYKEANVLITSLLNSGFSGLLKFVVLKVFVFLLFLMLYLALERLGYKRTGIYLIIASCIASTFVCLNNLFHMFSYFVFSVFVVLIFAFMPVVAFSEVSIGQ